MVGFRSSTSLAAIGSTLWCQYCRWKTGKDGKKITTKTLQNYNLLAENIENLGAIEERQNHSADVITHKTMFAIAQP